MLIISFFSENLSKEFSINDMYLYEH
jgi:hypothetical protein